MSSFPCLLCALRLERPCEPEEVRHVRGQFVGHTDVDVDRDLPKNEGKWVSSRKEKAVTLGSLEQGFKNDWKIINILQNGFLSILES